jgi:glycosyltransferase involved in cell wall biosynthesis
MFTNEITRNPLRVSVVITALNEAENLPHVLPYLPEWVDDVIPVDGGSTDNTVEAALQVWLSIRVIKPSGQGRGFVFNIL